MTGRQPSAIGDGGGGGGLWRITNSRLRRLGSDCSQPPIGSWSWWLWPSGLPHCSSPPSRVRHRRPRGSKGRGPCALCYAHPGDRPGRVVGSIRQLGIWLRALSEPVQWDDEQRRRGTNFDSPAFAQTPSISPLSFALLQEPPFHAISLRLAHVCAVSTSAFWRTPLPSVLTAAVTAKAPVNFVPFASVARAAYLHSACAGTARGDGS
ncbi:hypothetical protein IWZ03DRAFT_246000 [Phyllosticta citriasiana]|uniref:Uncharacterized protein n=1 Tax=Phyllosticta citriasiana TaxID=595635 RepID=A0ABR1KFX9_9PEZI